MARQFLYELFEKGASGQRSSPSINTHAKKQELPTTRQSKALSVSDLARALRRQLESVFADLWVQGEISGLRQYASGHWYFTLQDAGAQIPAVMFAADNRRLKFQPNDGDAILAGGRLSFYEKGGRAQLIVRKMEPWGAGARALAYKQLEDKLRREGLFAEDRKKAIPLCPRQLGIVTSPDGAALHDIITVTRRRFNNMPIILSPTRVQGQSAAQEIAQALRRLDQTGLCEVIIVGRGGGSEEDLSVFSSEVLVRAIAACHCPIITAVGHEVDVSICDHAADLRAATPSAAAERAIPVKQELLSAIAVKLQRAQKLVRTQMQQEQLRLESLRQILSDPTLLIFLRRQDLDTAVMRLQHNLDRRMQKARHRLDRRFFQLRALNPQQRLQPSQAELNRLQIRLHKATALDLQNKTSRLQNLRQRLQQNVVQKLHARRNSLAVFFKQLHALSPLLVLSRGYAVVRREQAIISQAEQLNVGDKIDIVFNDGQARVIVKSIQNQKEKIQIEDLEQGQNTKP